MRFTPLEIKKQDFSRTFRGFEPEEVRAFSELLARDVEEMLNERLRLDQQGRELERENEKYRQMEQTLRNAMLMASEMVQKAQARAESIIAAAEARSRSIVQEGEARAEECLAGVTDRRDAVSFEVESLERQRRDFVARLHEVVESQRAMLEAYERTEGAPDREA